MQFTQTSQDLFFRLECITFRRALSPGRVRSQVQHIDLRSTGHPDELLLLGLAPVFGPATMTIMIVSSAMQLAITCSFTTMQFEHHE